MSKTIDITGQRFGRLVVKERSGIQGGKALWFCECDCGETKVILSDSLRNGRSQSCGCLRRGLLSTYRKTHGQSGSKIYNIWQNMIRRCVDNSLPSYWRYGGRGITVCKRWMEFTNFFSDMGECPEGCSLDRINNDAGYSPENCRWATHTEQARNKSNTLKIQFNGVEFPLIDLADAAHINYFTFREMVYRVAERAQGKKAV